MGRAMGRELCSHAWTHCEVPPPLPLVTVARPGKLSSQVHSCRVVNTDFSVISVECRGNRIKLPLLEFSFCFYCSHIEGLVTTPDVYPSGIFV